MGGIMGPIAETLAEAKLMAARHGSPVLSYLIEMALIQSVEEEAELEQIRRRRQSPHQNQDDRTQAAP